MAAPHAIGVDIGGTGTKGAVVDASGELFIRAQIPTDPSAGTKSIIAVVEELVGLAAAEGLKIEGVGIGAAGFIDAATGTVTNSPNLVYDDPNIAAAVSSRVGLRTVVENDANAAAWGERSFGAARGLQHVAMLTLGTGIGSGFIVDGRLVRGATGSGAEFGHMVIHPGGEQCPCGLRGCIERYASGSAIARLAVAALDEYPDSAMVDIAGAADQITAEHVAQAAAGYDEAAMGVLRAAGRDLAIGLSNIVNLFEPEVIVLGGSVVAAGEPYLGAARDRWNEMLAAQRRRPVRLVQAQLGKDAGIVGAAALAMEERV